MSSEKTVPMVCPECRGTEDYYGILSFPGQETPPCPNHKTPDGEPRPVKLVPAK